MRWRGRMAVALALTSLGWPGMARGASLLPLVTEQAQTLPSGVAEATLGATYSKDMRFPFFTPPAALHSQTLVQAPQIGFHIGAGGWAEIQASYETIFLDERTADGHTNRQFGSGDARLGTKFWLMRETEVLPAFGLRFATKLPNATRGSRLGTDDTDFGADTLLSKDLGPVSAHMNLGILLLGNSGPTIGSSFTAGGQDDLFAYTVAVVSSPLGRANGGGVALRLLGEVTGLTGSRFGNGRSAARLGIQMTRGPATIYIGASAGLDTASENVGAGAGFIYNFKPGHLFDEE